MQSIIFHPVCIRSEKRYRPTVISVSKFDDKGVPVVEYVSLSDERSPLTRLNYDDFKLKALLDSGVSYSSLQLSPNMHIGHDKEIENFNNKLQTMFDSLTKE